MSFLNKYLNFDYRSFILPLIKKGRYRLIAYDDQEVPIISTTFYIDGDALNEINIVDGQILAEKFPEKLDAHLKKVEMQCGSMQVFIRHIQAVAFGLFSILPWLYNPSDYIYFKLGVSGFLAMIVFLVRNWIPKVFIRIVGKFFKL